MARLHAAARALWRTLPVSVRRPMARHALGAFAPELTPDALFVRHAPWIVVGFLTSASGLGQAARLACLGLRAEGHEVFGVDLGHAFHESHGAVAFAFDDGRRAPARANILLCINAPYMRYACALLGARFLRGRAVLGYWVWELERAPGDWRPGLACAHRVAAPSAFAARAVEAIGSAPVLVAPHPVALGRGPLPEPREEAAPFTVLSVASAASGFERKNPVALIAAFRKAFGGSRDHRLRLRVSGLESYAPGRSALREAIGDAPNIELATETLSDLDLARWWGAPDLYASLHRAEGFGLPIAEAMCAGTPALATNWSANTEYMTDATGYLVRAMLVPVDDPQQKYEAHGNRWAEPDIDYAVELLRAAASDRDVLRAKGQAARESALSRFSRFDLAALWAAEARLPG